MRDVTAVLAGFELATNPAAGAMLQPLGRGLHSSTFQLNSSVFRGIRGAFRGYVEGD